MRTRAFIWARWLSVASMASFAAVPALATNFGSSGSIGTNDFSNPPDNGVWLRLSHQMEVRRRLLTTSVANAVIDTITRDYQPNTDMNATTYSSSTCPSNSQQICVFDDYYGTNGYHGWNQCHSGTVGVHPWQACNTGYVKINLMYDPSQPPDPGGTIYIQNYHALLCHELGHSIGLRHSTEVGSCMNDPPYNQPLTFYYRWLTGHDINHINSIY